MAAKKARRSCLKAEIKIKKTFWINQARLENVLKTSQNLCFQYHGYSY